MGTGKTRTGITAIASPHEEETGQGRSSGNARKGSRLPRLPVRSRSRAAPPARHPRRASSLRSLPQDAVTTPLALTGRPCLLHKGCCLFLFHKPPQPVTIPTARLSEPRPNQQERIPVGLVLALKTLEKGPGTMLYPLAAQDVHQQTVSTPQVHEGLLGCHSPLGSLFFP